MLSVNVRSCFEDVFMKLPQHVQKNVKEMSKRLSLQWSRYCCGTPYNINEKIHIRNFAPGILKFFLICSSAFLLFCFKELKKSKPWAKFGVFSSCVFSVSTYMFLLFLIYSYLLLVYFVYSSYLSYDLLYTSYAFFSIYIHDSYFYVLSHLFLTLEM